MKRDFLVIYIPIYLKMLSIMRDDVCIAQQLIQLMRWRSYAMRVGAGEHDFTTPLTVLDARRMWKRMHEY